MPPLYRESLTPGPTETSMAVVEAAQRLPRGQAVAIDQDGVHAVGTPLLPREAQRRFQAGKRYYQSQDIVNARREFDRAIDLMLAHPKVRAARVSTVFGLSVPSVSMRSAVIMKIGSSGSYMLGKPKPMLWSRQPSATSRIAPSAIRDCARREITMSGFLDGGRRALGRRRPTNKVSPD